jgi:putative inorganic carbon (HCO3(-)) transporter
VSAAIVVPVEVQFRRDPLTAAQVLPIKFLLLCISAPDLLFLLALTAMLFRPPDLKLLPIDRIAFIALVGAVAIRVCIRRERLRTFPATWPMLFLLLLGVWGVMTHAYDTQALSLLAAKWLVPFVLFHIASFVFSDERGLHRLELYLLVVLAYLAAISVFFLFGAESLIYPRFILDESIGIHADRARGPFLQAVANGLSLNILGIFALDAYRGDRLKRFAAGGLFLAVPVALLATKTRAIWLSAAVSILWIAFTCRDQKLGRAARTLCVMTAVGVCGALVYQINSDSLAERLADRSPVDFRSEIYQAGVQMFLEKPLTGWGADADLQPEIEKRVSSFRPEHYVFHNTYLELAAQRGLLGLGLYAWLIICLFRLGSLQSGARNENPGFLDIRFRTLWPVIVGVYVINASVVVMNYQFVNAFVFTIAGILSAQNTEAATHTLLNR